MVVENKIQRYAKYRDSGVEWLEEIPEDWNTLPIRAIFEERNEKNDGPKTDFILSVTKDRGVIPYDEKGAIGNNKSEDIERYKLVYPNDFVINKMNVVIGSLGMSKYFGAFSVVYLVYKPKTKDININYYSYLFSNPSFYKSLIRYCKGIMELRESLDKNDFKKLVLPFPKIGIQTKIVDFLDDKTTKIDEAISIKEQQINLLKERKRILIHKAVTRGLDDTVKLKDSGVEWIGEIPVRWEVKKLKYSTKIFRGKFTHRPRNDERMYDGEYPFFQTGDVARAGKFLSAYKQTLNENGLRVSTLFPKGTIVITIAANIGDISILDIDACFPDSIVGFEPNVFVEKDFLYNSLLVMKEQFMSSTIKNTQMNLNVDRIGSNSIVIPSIEEQKEISEYIETASQKIETAISLKQQEIAKLKEYKSSLINSVVTGKVKVC
jgi:type I restriction enzyme, S subunit